MIHARSTTWQERIAIVQDYLAQQKNYRRVAEQHQVSYNQVYRWVQKYEQGGWEALEDRRGHSRQPKVLTNEEQAKQEKRRIEKENEQLRMENAFLKKLQDIERRDR
ncbi:helix-turn-helix domain-containing protein [uncultured Marinococcus sp.]|uniref:helix-turn-helix domain-containing protein n=1 Tax=uncultured Marinococcus sp. TaxID=487012 RepID=UPI002607EE87|nr:helix-turn-helix domain-containing protein [uncultured Marinococcus sp.]